MKYKPLKWKKVSEDMDYEDLSENFQKWQSKIVLIDNDDMFLELAFTITKRDNTDYFLMISAYAQDVSSLWIRRERDIPTLIDAKGKANKYLDTFCDGILETIENLKLQKT